MASLGTLFLELAANTARLQSDMGKAVGIVENASAKIKTAFKFAGGGLLATAFINAAKQSIEFGDSINKASIKAGIGNKAMSELAYAAKLADVDIASLSTAIKKMQVSLSEAGTGAKGPTEALAALGLTIEQVKRRRPEAQFELLADRISKLNDPADKARAAVDLFGKAGADLLPLFEQGAAGIAKARAEAEKLGLSFSDDQIKKLSAADDSIKRLKASFAGFFTTIAAGVAGPLSEFADALSGLDTRSTDQKIAQLEKRLNTPSILSPTGAGRARLQAELDSLKGRQELEAVRAAQTGTSGGPQSRGRDGLAIGYAAADAAAKAKDVADKARADDLKEQQKWAHDSAEINRALNRELGEDLDRARDEKMDKFFEDQERADEYIREHAELMKKLQQEQANEINENAMLFEDAFLNAFDDMVNTGKFKWDELLKYMIAEFARRGIVKLFDGLFTGGGGGLGKWITKGISAIGGLFGGQRAGGGGVSAGKVYEVGERGRELFAPGMNGSIIPNHALGGSSGLNVTYNIDNRGATADAMKMLPAILRQNNEMLEGRIVERLERRYYPSLS